MAKPLWHWTVGPCIQQGFDVLAESINRTTRALGVDDWDWVVCHNGINREELQFIQKAIGTRPIQLLNQCWATCPISDNCQSPRRKDGTFEWNGTRCGGSLWKVCPPRLRMETHEVVMDNDIVLLKKPPQIDEFLKANKALILEEPIRFYGRYDCLFGPDAFLNSGLMGFPPDFDYGAMIMSMWEKHGRYMNLTQADEQGLLTYSLNQMPNIRIRKEQIVEVLHRDFKTKITGREDGIHFTQANRIPNHFQWGKYRETVSVISTII